MNERDFVKRASKILDEQGYKYRVGDNDEIIMTFGADLGEDIPLMQIIRMTQEKVLLVTTVPYNIRKDRRDEISRKMMEINYGLICGSFDLDVTDGDLRFRSAFFCKNPKKMKKEQLLGNIGLGVMMYDKVSVEIKDSFEDKDIAGRPSTIDLSDESD